VARKIKKRKLEKKILILGEGTSEQSYFIEMKESEHLSYTIKPELPKNSNYDTIFKKAENEAEYYLKVFCLIDLDYIIRDGLYSEYNNYKQKLQRENKNVQIFENYPCLETWFAFHYAYFSREFASCKDLINEFLNIKNRLMDYKKGASSRKYYNQLKPYQNEAIIRAERTFQNRSNGIAENLYRVNDCQVAFTEIYLIIRELLS